MKAFSKMVEDDRHLELAGAAIAALRAFLLYRSPYVVRAVRALA